MQVREGGDMNDETQDMLKPGGAPRGKARRTKGSWAGALGALVLWAAPWQAAHAQAESSDFEQDLLVEGQHPEDPGLSAHRLACEGRFCLWHLTQYLGPCAAYRCSGEHLVLTDREGHVLPAAWRLSPYDGSSARFLGPYQIELLTWSSRSNHEWPEIDQGVDPTSVWRQVLKLSRDGTKFTLDPGASREPAWKTKPAQRRAKDTGSEKPGAQVPVSEALLARARAACASDETLFPRHHECHEGTCVLILDGDETAVDKPEDQRDENSCRGFLCTALVKGDEVRKLPVGEDATGLEITPDFYAYSACTGPYGSSELNEVLSRRQPERKAFADTPGLQLEGSDPYPVREAKTVEAARALAPTVHAYTQVHIPWGRNAWRDDKDLALAWQVMRVGNELRLHAEVDDDMVVPSGTGTGVHSDHLELTVWKQPPAKDTAGLPLRKLGVLLGAEGQVQVRLWTREEEGKARDVDEAYAPARGTWSRSARGYEVDLTLPLAVLGEDKPLTSALFSVMASDADERRKQETLMGHQGTLRFWTEYPPTHEEYLRIMGPQAR
jgi:hypothetical protein